METGTTVLTTLPIQNCARLTLSRFFYIQLFPTLTLSILWMNDTTTSRNDLHNWPFHRDYKKCIKKERIVLIIFSFNRLLMVYSICKVNLLSYASLTWFSFMLYFMIVLVPQQDMSRHLCVHSSCLTQKTTRMFVFMNFKYCLYMKALWRKIRYYLILRTMDLGI